MRLADCYTGRSCAGSINSALLLLGRLLFAATRYPEALEIYHRALARIATWKSRTGG